MSVTKYGNIDNLSPTGASSATASQDGISATGVSASHTLAKTDKARLEKNKDDFVEVGNKYGIQPALIAAIASRESRAGNMLDANGYGKSDPNGYGLMQIDVKTSGVSNPTKNAWNSRGHIDQAVGKVLVPMIEAVQKKHPTWTLEQQLQGGVAAYNFGVKNVQTLGGLDKGSTGNDYSNDVIARAQYLKDNGF